MQASPKLVDEAFVTDVEMRYELGQLLHTRGAGASSSSCAVAAQAAAAAACARGAQARGLRAVAAPPRRGCTAFSRTVNGVCAAAASGGRVCLRLHVVTRGLDVLTPAGGDSVARCLERLREGMERWRRHKTLQNHTAAATAVYDEARRTVLLAVSARARQPNQALLI